MDGANAMTRPSRLITGGFWRAAGALKPIVRAEVHTEYAEKLQSASFVGRVLLKREMNREIKRRVLAQAPPDALY
jgi:hypothetical protein